MPLRVRTAPHFKSVTSLIINVDTERRDTAFPRLEVLRLYASDINDITLRLGAGRMRSLKRLELLACQGVSVTGILEFAKGQNQGFELLIDACPGVMQEDLPKLTKFANVL